MDELQSVLENIEPDFWIDTLPAYQRDSVRQMRAKGVPYEQIAATWIAASTSTTAPFSSGNVPPPDLGFIEKLQAEVRAFLCGDKRYDADRKKLLASGGQLQMVVVSAMSAAIAPTVGSVAVVVLPLIALILATLGKFSLNAYCAAPTA
jgi:hypothetical protein